MIFLMVFEQLLCCFYGQVALIGFLFETNLLLLHIFARTVLQTAIISSQLFIKQQRMFLLNL